MDKQEIYESRKKQLEAVGAIYSVDDNGFVINHNFIANDDVLNGDEADFEETFELAQMSAWTNNV